MGIMNQVQQKSSITSESELNSSRRGAILVVVAFLIIIFLIMTAMSVDLAYMQLIRSEMRAATDAASRAGAVALVQTQNKQSAIAAAIDAAGKNSVAGRP